MKKNFGAKAWLYPMPVLIIGTYDEDGKPIALLTSLPKAKRKLSSQFPYQMWYNKLYENIRGIP